MIYFMKGTYMQDGKEYSQVGIFAIRGSRNMGTILGYILDPASESPIQSVEGHVSGSSTDDGQRRVKIGFSKKESRIKYVLEKSEEEYSLRGSYEGYWINPDSGLSEDRQSQTNIVKLTLDNKL